MRMTLLFMAVCLSWPTSAQSNADVAAQSHEVTLDDIRVMYIDAIYERVPVRDVLDAIERTRATSTEGLDLLAVYRGAATVLRARDAVWPGSKLKYTRRGLAALDDAVALHPDNVELRFLRLISCYRLPGFLGRGWSVDEDMEILVARFASLDGKVPPMFYNEVETFVRDHGSASPNTKEQ